MVYTKPGSKQQLLSLGCEILMTATRGNPTKDCMAEPSMNILSLFLYANKLDSPESVKNVVQQGIIPSQIT